MPQVIFCHRDFWRSFLNPSQSSSLCKVTCKIIFCMYTEYNFAWDLAKDVYVICTFSNLSDMDRTMPDVWKWFLLKAPVAGQWFMAIMVYKDFSNRRKKGVRWTQSAVTRNWLKSYIRKLEEYVEKFLNTSRVHIDHFTFTGADVYRKTMIMSAKFEGLQFQASFTIITYSAILWWKERYFQDQQNVSAWSFPSELPPPPTYPRQGAPAEVTTNISRQNMHWQYFSLDHDGDGAIDNEMTWRNCLQDMLQISVRNPPACKEMCVCVLL